MARASVRQGAQHVGAEEALDVVARHELVADILLATDMNGFTHEELALVSALVRLTGDRHADTKAYGPLIAHADRLRLHRAAVILALGDAIEARCARGRPIAVTCTVGRRVTVSVPQLLSWRALPISVTRFDARSASRSLS
jgi:exopolyphosphatase/pppGpp-phosphohydrolase